MKPVYAFIGGAVLGAALALLLAPETGEETRARLRALLAGGRKGDSDPSAAGGIGAEELAMLMNQITAEVEDDDTSK